MTQFVPCEGPTRPKSLTKWLSVLGRTSVAPRPPDTRRRKTFTHVVRQRHRASQSAGDVAFTKQG